MILEFIDKNKYHVFMSGSDQTASPDVKTGSTPLAEQKLDKETNKSTTQKEVLTIKEKEIAPKVSRLLSPEREARTIDVDKQKVVGEISFSLKIVSEMQGVDPNSWLGQTLVLFKESYEKEYGKDFFKDSDKLNKAVNDFVQKNPGNGVLLALKFRDFRGAAVAACVNGLYHEDVSEVEISPEKQALKIIIDQNGARVEPILIKGKPKSSGLFESIKLWINPSPTPVTQSEFSVTIGNKVFLDSNAMLNDTQKEYLKLMGFQEGMDLSGNTKESSENMLVVVKSLAEVTEFKTDLMRRTGAIPHADDLNYIEEVTAAGKKIWQNKTRGRAYFRFENQTAEVFRDRIEQEGKDIITVLKIDVENQIRQRIEAEQKGIVDETNAERIGKRIEKIRTKATSLTLVEKVAKEKEADKKIAAAQKKEDDFTEYQGLPDEISQAEVDIQNKKTTIEAYQSTLPGKPDLLTLDGGLSVNGSLTRVKQELSNLTIQRDAITAQTTRKERRIDAIEKTGILAGSRVTYKLGPDQQPVKDEQGNVIVETFQPNEYTNKLIAEWERLTAEVETHYKQIEQAEIQGGKSLSQQIEELTTKVKESEGILAETAAREALNAYYQVQRTLVGKQSRQTELETKYKFSDVTNLADIKKEVETAQKEKEAIGGISEDEQRDVDALTAFKRVYETDGKKIMEDRIHLAEDRKMIGKTDELASTPDFDSYPPVVRRVIQLMFGDNVLLGLADEALINQVQALLKSKNYIDIINSKTQNISWENIDRDLVMQIRDEILSKALGITKI